MADSDTYPVYYLGTFARLDTAEGNPVAEDAASLTDPSQNTFGSTSDPLSANMQIMAPVGSPGDFYRTNNNLYTDQFSIDGGAAQTFDSMSQYDATITYSDGTPDATISAVVFQDTDGRLYLAPELSNNSDQMALNAAPIESITLNSLINNSNFGMDVVRFVCFGRGTLIDTEHGPTRIENLKAGDLIRTRDHGLQPIRWIDSQIVTAKDGMAPVHIAAGALGNAQELVVSQQHRVLLTGDSIQGGQALEEYFVPAKKLIDDDAIRLREDGTVEYFHLLMSRHEVIYSEAIPTESFYLGPQAWLMLPERCQQGILQAMPELPLDETGAPIYGPLARPVGKLRESNSCLTACAA